METLSQLIKEKKFDWVNNFITDVNFPVPALLPSEKTEYRVFHFNKDISSKDVIENMQKEGYSPANLYELLAYDWNGKDLIVALGSVAEVYGDRSVPCLSRGASRRRLRLRWWLGGWPPFSRFLAVRNSQTLESKKKDLGDLESLTLRVEKLEKMLESVAKALSTHND